jgi:hypothetical protein
MIGGAALFWPNYVPFHDEWVTAAFRVEVGDCYADYDRFTDPETWPVGTRVEGAYVPYAIPSGARSQRCAGGRHRLGGSGARGLGGSGARGLGRNA